jgi:hypothetical protein
MVSRFLLIAYAMAGVALTGAVRAAELAPGSGHSIRLAAFEGVVYYTVEQDGYRVVATLAPGADTLPIRMTSTLLPGQSAIVSVPQSDGRPPLDFQILRDGDTLVVIDAVVPVVTEHVDEAPTIATSGE